MGPGSAEQREGALHRARDTSVVLAPPLVQPPACVPRMLRSTPPLSGVVRC